MADQGRTIPRKLNPFGFYSPLLVTGSLVQKRIPEDEQKIMQHIGWDKIISDGVAHKKSPIYIHSRFYQTIPPQKNLAASKVDGRLWLGGGAGLAFLVALGRRGCWTGWQCVLSSVSFDRCADYVLTSI